MRNLILQEFVTLDGFAAGLDESEDFIPASVAGDQSFGQHQMDFIDAVDTILLGQVTYEMFAQYWPSVTSGEDKSRESLLSEAPSFVSTWLKTRRPSQQPCTTCFDNKLNAVCGDAEAAEIELGNHERFRADLYGPSAIRHHQERNNMSTEPKRHDLIVTRVFDAPVEQVWNAWRDPEQVMQWWGPNGFTCPMTRMDFREGGTSLVCMRSPEYGDFYNTWTYETIVPMERIGYLSNLADQDGNNVDPAAMGFPPDFPRDQRHTVTFKALEDDRTEMTVTEYDWPVGQMMEMSQMGLEQCLDKMAASFTKG